MFKKKIILQDQLFLRYVAMNWATETSNVLDTRAYFNRCSRLSSLKYSPGVKGPGRIDGRKSLSSSLCHRATKHVRRQTKSHVRSCFFLRPLRRPENSFFHLFFFHSFFSKSRNFYLIVIRYVSIFERTKLEFRTI